jgi:hypothetical protein
MMLVRAAGVAHAQGAAGSALQFDGTDDSAVVRDAPSLCFSGGSPATFEAWLMPTAEPAVWHAFGKRAACSSTSDLNYQMARDASSRIHFRSTSCVASAGIDLQTNHWSHLAVSTDGATTRILVNGGPTGLEGHWKFDEAASSQTILDSSSNGNDGTLGSSVAVDTNDPSRIPSSAPFGECIFVFNGGFESGNTTDCSSTMQ